MANEWQSLLSQAPNMANLNLVKTAQDAFGTAQDQKIKAYDQYRLQKAQEIASKATRPDGTMDWDAMFKLGSEAGIGLDAFNQVQKMQSDRRSAEVAQAQNRMVLESMGYDPTRWDPSAGTIADQTYRQQYGKDAQPAPYVAPTAEEAYAYDFLTAPSTETQIPQAGTGAFSAGPLGETEQTQGAPSAPVQTAPPDVVPAANEVIITPNATPSSGTFTLPELPMPERQVQQTEGYYNELWRAKRDPEAMQRMLQGSAVGATGPQLSVAQMSDAEKANLSRYLAMRGIANADPQQALTALENMAIQSVPQPVLNPMVGMMSKDDQAKEYGRYRQAVAEYPAKVQEAIAKVSDSIKSGNMDVVTQNLARTASRIAQEGNLRAEEKQEFDLSAQKGQIFTRPVSSEEARIVKQQRAAISDIIAAPSTFAGAYQAAVAKAKSDGSVNEDAIVSNLVAMNAMPSEDAIYLKTMMNPDGSLTAAGKKWIVNATLGQRGPSAEWKANAIANINQYISDNGGKAVEYTAPPPEKPTQSKIEAPIGGKVPLRGPSTTSRKGRSL